jgi:hypothetical protein
MVRSREFQDKEGQKRTAFEVHADSVSFLGGFFGAQRAASEAMVPADEDVPVIRMAEVIPVARRGRPRRAVAH